MKKCLVLLSTFNGNKYLREQIDSLLNQKGVDVNILVRDDGSQDNTVEILKRYNDTGKVSYYCGQNLGYAKSFWDLLFKSGESDYYAFCDQDDFWAEDKLVTAVDMLEAENNNIPLLYFSDVKVVDENLNIISEGMVDKDAIIDYAHSLIKNIAPGCTYVFNSITKELLLKYDCYKFGITYHDWIVYNVVACFGKVIFDKNAHILYRQHGNNCVGANNNHFGNIINSIKRFFNKSNDGKRSAYALNIEKCYSELMSDNNREITKFAAHYKENKKIKKQFLKEKSFFEKGLSYKYLKLLIKLNKF